jgi:hypothetical protein
MIFFSILLFQYCHQRDYTFKSSLFCVVGVWILIFLSELLQIPMHLEWYVNNNSNNNDDNNNITFFMATLTNNRRTSQSASRQTDRQIDVWQD